MKASTSGRDGAPDHAATARRSRTTGGPSHTPAQAEKEGPAYSLAGRAPATASVGGSPRPVGVVSGSTGRVAIHPNTPYIALRRLYRPLAARSPPRCRPGPAGGRRTAPRASRRRGGWSRVAAAIRRRDPSTMLVNLSFFAPPPPKALFILSFRQPRQPRQRGLTRCDRSLPVLRRRHPLEHPRRARWLPRRPRHPPKDL